MRYLVPDRGRRIRDAEPDPSFSGASRFRPSYFLSKPLQLSKHASECDGRVSQNGQAAANPTTHYSTPKHVFAGSATGTLSF